MLKFSLLVPTRGRIESLKRYLKSVSDTVGHPEDIEVLLVYDNDDLETIEALEGLKEEYKHLSLSCYETTRTEFSNENYYNFLARKAKGRYIWANANDLVFLVANWDIKLWFKLNYFMIDKPDRLVCANILDNTPGPGNPPADKKEFPCFPLFSREVLDVLGFILAPQLPTWGADRYAYRLFSQVERFLVINNEVYLDHISYHKDYKTVKADDLTTRAGDLCAKYAKLPKHDYHKQTPIILQQAKQLKEYINERKLDHA